MIKRLVLCAAFLYATNGAFAGDGSPLSSKGVGAFTSFAGGYSVGMGNAGLALLYNASLSRLNPATWSALQNVQFSALYDFSGVSSQDNLSNESSYLVNGNFGGGIFGIPIDRDLGISLAMGFTPLTSFQYQFNSAIAATAETPSATYVNTGSGGLGEGFLGTSLSPFKELALGGMFTYAFGRTERTGQVTFSNTSYTNTFSDNSLYLHGSSGTLGLTLSHLDDLVKLDFLHGLSIAGYYKLSYNLKGNSQLSNTYSDGLDTAFTSFAAGYIPPEYGIGIAENFSGRLSAVLDIRTQQLSRYSDSFTSPGTFGDVLFVGGGIQYMRGKAIDALYDKPILRAGFYYEKTQYIVPTKSGQNKQLDELFLTAGIEVPLSYSSTINVSAQYGFRGLSNDLPIQERIFRLYVSVTLGEVWFIRPVGD